jgi:Mrp family chromosome partitioning ATPase
MAARREAAERRSGRQEREVDGSIGGDARRDPGAATSDGAARAPGAEAMRPADGPAAAPAPGRKLLPRPPRTITYTRTRVFRPDPEVLRRNRVITALDDDPAVHAYKVLRTQVRQRLNANGWNTLAITSPKGAEGKTLTAVNLAIILAMEVNHSVLLVDLDLRKPGVHRYFGYEPQLGVSDFLTEHVDVSEMLFNPGIDRLVVLPGREPVFSSSEALSSPQTVELVEELKSRYPARLVLFDLPPVLSADDAMAFAPYVDAALMVIEEGNTTQDDVLLAVEYLGDTPIIGSVLNRSPEGRWKRG